MDFIDVLTMAVDHAARSGDNRARMPQWFFERLSSLLELVFLAPHSPGGFAKVRRQLRQHLMNLVRFQAVVKLRFEGRSVDEACDLAAQTLKEQGYKGGDEAVRRSYKRILRSIRDVEVAIGESGTIKHEGDLKEVENELARRKVIISDACAY